jgi:hypothetical protein
MMNHSRPSWEKRLLKHRSAKAEADGGDDQCSISLIGGGALGIGV